MQKYPDNFLKATLVKRINRFVAEVILNNEKLNVYVPNTGRLSELALPGVQLLLLPINAKYKFKILYIINRSFPVMIDSTNSNKLFYELLCESKIPGIDQYKKVRREPVYGNHRFDFLLSGGDTDVFIELKSCTLFHNKTGAFPDAVSSRASEHVKALAESGIGKLIFLVLRNDIEKFIPNYHTDFIFYETLKKYKNKIDIHAYTVQYDDKLKIQSLKEIPVLIPDIKPAGIFLLLLFNPEDTVNDDGEILKHGFYIYCGDHEENVFETIAAIKRKNGINKILNGIQFSKMRIISDTPIVSTSITIDDLINKLIQNEGTTYTSDYMNTAISGNKLLYFTANPLEKSWFWDVVFDARFGEYN